MTESVYPRRRRGAAGVLFILSAILAGIGLAFDFLRPHQHPLWIGALPGGRAAIGAGAVLVCVAVAHLLRLVLARPDEEER